MKYTAEKATYIWEIQLQRKKKKKKRKTSYGYSTFLVCYLRSPENFECGSSGLQKPSYSLHRSLLQTEKSSTLPLVLFWLFMKFSPFMHFTSIHIKISVSNVCKFIYETCYWSCFDASNFSVTFFFFSRTLVAFLMTLKM